MSIPHGFPPVSQAPSFDVGMKPSIPRSSTPTIRIRNLPVPSATAFPPAPSDASMEPSTPHSVSSIAQRTLFCPDPSAFSPCPSTRSSEEPSSPLLCSPSPNRCPRTPLSQRSSGKFTAARNLLTSPLSPPPSLRSALLLAPINSSLFPIHSSLTTPIAPKPPSPFFTRLKEIRDTKTIAKEERSFSLQKLIGEGDYAEIYPITGETCLIPSIPNEQILIRLYQKYHLEKGEKHLSILLKNQLNNYRELQMVGIPTPTIYNLSTATTDGYLAVARIPDPLPSPKESPPLEKPEEKPDPKKQFTFYREQVRQILCTCYAYGIVADAKADNLRIDAKGRVVLIDWLEESQELIPFLRSTLHSFASANDPDLNPCILPLPALREKPLIPNLRQTVLDDFLGREVPKPPSSPILSPLPKKSFVAESELTPKYTGILAIKKKHIDASAKQTSLPTSFVDEVAQLQIDSGLGAFPLQTLRTLQNFQKELQLIRNSQDRDSVIESLDLLKVQISDTEVKSLSDLYALQISEIPLEALPEEIRQFADNLVEEIATYLSQGNLSIREYLAGRAE